MSQESMSVIYNDFLTLLQTSGLEALGEAQMEVTEVAEYVATRASHLSKAINEPGFQQAVLAERDNVALFAGISAVNLAEAQQLRFMGLIEGSLTLGARAFALALGAPATPPSA